MEEKERKGVRGLRDQLLTLVNGWDPTGLLQAGASRDQYAPVVDELLGLLSQRAPKDEISRFLDNEISARFGSKPPGSDQFARKAISWYQIESPEP